MQRVPPGRIARLIYPVGFYRTKARAIRAICRDLLGRFGGRVPDEIGICVDTHVHRISNRLGYVRTKTPEATEMALRARLPRRYWIGYNDLLVAFGQNVCTPLRPRCSACPVRPLCRRVGVTASR